MFRASQKNIEKELGALQTAVADLVKKAQADETAPDEAVKAVDAMIKKTENLKRKVRLGTFLLVSC